jgi:hypothetical protein
MISVVAFWRLPWRHIDAALRFCFGRAGGLLKVFSFLLGVWTAQILGLVMDSGGWAIVGFIAPITLFFWLARRYKVRPIRPEAAQRSSPEPEPPPHIVPEAVRPAVFPLLKLCAPFTRAEAIAAFRRRSMELHPDHGGNTTVFRMLLTERKRALELAWPR